MGGKRETNTEHDTHIHGIIVGWVMKTRQDQKLRLEQDGVREGGWAE